MTGLVLAALLAGTGPPSAPVVASVRLETEPAAAADLALALVRRGYLAARVVGRSRPAAVGGAEAVFTVSAGPLVRVGSTRVEAPAVFADTMRAEVRPLPGEVFEREKAVSAGEKMRQALVRAGHWSATVAV